MSSCSRVTALLLRPGLRHGRRRRRRDSAEALGGNSSCPALSCSGSRDVLRDSQVSVPTSRSQRDRRRQGKRYFKAASFSASSSQLFTRWITDSRAGMPAGNSSCRRASLSTLCRVLASSDRLPDARRPFDEPSTPAFVLRRRRCVDVPLDAPATPCARRRWAPSAAGRSKLLPHSGHVSALLSPVPSGSFRRLAIRSSLHSLITSRVATNDTHRRTRTRPMPAGE